MVSNYAIRICAEEFQRCVFESCERKNKITTAKKLIIQETPHSH
jgi:hypothetical protein